MPTWVVMSCRSYHESPVMTEWQLHHIYACMMTYLEWNCCSKGLKFYQKCKQMCYENVCILQNANVARRLHCALWILLVSLILFMGCKKQNSKACHWSSFKQIRLCCNILIWGQQIFFYQSLFPRFHDIALWCYQEIEDRIELYRLRGDFVYFPTSPH